MEKKKLLITTDSFFPKIDGTSRFVLEIIPFLKKHFDITIIAPDYRQIYKGEKLPKIKDVNLITIPLSWFGFGDYRAAKFKFFKVMNEVKKNDIIFVNVSGAIGSAAILSAKLFGKPIVNLVHVLEWEYIPRSISLNWLRRPMQIISTLYGKFLYNLSDLLIVPTEEVAAKLSSRGIIAPKTIATLGVDTKKFSPPKNKHSQKKKYKLEDYFVIGYCSRLSREKDPETVLKAFRILYPKYKDMRLLVIGDGLEEFKEKFRKGKNVIYLGKKTNVEEYYKLMDVFYFTSLTETTGFVILEAMSCALPVISTNVGIANFAIKNGKNGFIINKKDYLELAKATEKLYKDRTLREDIGKKARKTILEDFSFEKSASKIREILSNFID